MKELFKTYKIKFENRNEFNFAIDLTNFSIDIGYSDKILVYDNEYFRDRFFRYLRISGIQYIEKY